jgi:5-(aminomethyl)-3-furanmethanol phosphate kinase
VNQPRIPLRVVKVGGSLLSWPELPSALPKWLAAMPPARNILVCGGGAFTDAIRQADADFSLGEETAHWLAIDALALAARLLAAVMPAALALTTYAALEEQIACSQPSVVVFDPVEFLWRHEGRLPGVPLPHTWQVTTDSIAARLAELLGADELVLLKSSAAPATELAALAEAGYVDRQFPRAAAGLARVRFVNLRALE